MRTHAHEENSCERGRKRDMNTLQHIENKRVPKVADFHNRAVLLQFLTGAPADNMNSVQVVFPRDKRQKVERHVKGTRKEILGLVGRGQCFRNAVRNHDEVQISADFVFL